MRKSLRKTNFRRGSKLQKEWFSRDKQGTALNRTQPARTFGVTGAHTRGDSQTTCGPRPALPVCSRHHRNRGKTSHELSARGSRVSRAEPNWWVGQRKLRTIQFHVHAAYKNWEQPVSRTNKQIKTRRHRQQCSGYREDGGRGRQMRAKGSNARWRKAVWLWVVSTLFSIHMTCDSIVRLKPMSFYEPTSPRSI